MIFYVGLHHPGDAQHFAHACISINRIRGRKKPLNCADWILDSGAFNELRQFNAFRHTPEEYAEEVNRLARINPGITVAVSQDYMCEPFMLAKTGFTVREHQQLTIERYQQLRNLIEVPLMPVLQGTSMHQYLEHIKLYGKLLTDKMWVGVGSVCRRNAHPTAINMLLNMIRSTRPDLRLHGFGLKKTALASAHIRSCLYSADSMVWSFTARMEGKNANDPQHARAFVELIEGMQFKSAGFIDVRN